MSAASTWLDSCVIVNRRLRFEHDIEAVDRAAEAFGPFAGATDDALARSIVAGVHGALGIARTALGAGMPRTLDEIVRRRAGNCVSFTVLCVALIRRHGLPARLVVEDVYTNWSMLRAPAALLPVPIGPTLNGHVWLEVAVDGRWIPADAELGIYGTEDWIRRRLRDSVRVRALGLPVSERWRFPLRIRALSDDGVPAEDRTEAYLVEALSPAPSAVWVAGVQYFSGDFDWSGRAGLRLLTERKRLRRMAAVLATWRRTGDAPARPE